MEHLKDQQTTLPGLVDSHKSLFWQSTPSPPCPKEVRRGESKELGFWMEPRVVARASPLGETGQEEGGSGQRGCTCKYLETKYLEHLVMREFHSKSLGSYFKSYSYFKVPFELQLLSEISGIMQLSSIFSFSRSLQHLSSYCMTWHVIL